MVVEVICNGEYVNVFRDGGMYEKEAWGNPFIEFPCVGDFIELGAHEIDRYEPFPMKKYQVINRTFSAVASYNNRYTKHKCILEVKEV